MQYLVNNYTETYMTFDEDDFEFYDLDENDEEIVVDDFEELELKIMEINNYAYNHYEIFDDIDEVKDHYKYEGSF